MTAMVKRVAVFVALLVALLGGWLWGASAGRSPARALEAVELRNDLLEARTSLAAARADLESGDVREMSRHLEDVRRFARRVAVRLEHLGWKAEAERLDLAGLGAQIDAAERLGRHLLQSGRTRSPRTP
jgi:hypothetical protein